MLALVSDLKHALRIVKKNPGFTAAAVLSLGLGIGATSTVFTLLNATVLRPISVEGANELVLVYNEDDGTPFAYDLSYRELRDYRVSSKGVFSDLMGYTALPLNLSAGDQNERIYGEVVSEGYFGTLQVEAALGRTFSPSEHEAPGSASVTVLSHAFWQSRFGGDASVVGSTVRLNGQLFDIVGVAPEGFHGVYYIGFQPALWVPTEMIEALNPQLPDVLDDRTSRYMRTMGRLAPGVSLEQARAAIATTATALAEEYPDTNRGVTATVLTLDEGWPESGLTGQVRFGLAIFMGVVGMVLIVACANVANLLLAKAAARHREMSMRMALGASRTRLARQLLTESLLLAFLGGVTGLALTRFAAALVMSVQLPVDIPFVFDLRPDLSVLAFTVVVTAATAILFGLAPALQQSRTSLVSATKAEGGAVAGGGRSRLRSVFVVAQVAVCLAILTTAGLFLASLRRAGDIDTGIGAERLAMISVDPALNGYDEGERAQLYRELLTRTGALPGVEAATIAGPIPLDLYARALVLAVSDQSVREGEETMTVLYSALGPRYFETMQTTLLRGRDFTWADDVDTPAVTIVNETLAERLWPGEDAIGKNIRLDGGEESPRALRVVGVAKDGKYRMLGEAPRPYMFIPLLQRNGFQHVSIVARTARDPVLLLAPMRAQVEQLDGALPVFDAKTLDEFMFRSFFGARVAAILVGVVASIGLMLAAVGLYGVLAYTVSQRTREIGIRMAFGAAGRDVVTLAVRQGVILTGVGIALGLVAGVGLGQLVSSILYDTSGADPLVFAAVSLVMFAVAVVACLVPAWKALRVDPLVALRYE